MPGGPDSRRNTEAGAGHNCVLGPGRMATYYSYVCMRCKEPRTQFPRAWPISTQWKHSWSILSTQWKQYSSVSWQQLCRAHTSTHQRSIWYARTVMIQNCLIRRPPALSKHATRLEHTGGAETCSMYGVFQTLLAAKGLKADPTVSVSRIHSGESCGVAPSAGLQKGIAP